MSEGSDDEEMWDGPEPWDVLQRFLAEPDYWELMRATYEFQMDDGSIGTFSPRDVEIVKTEEFAAIHKGKGEIRVHNSREVRVHNSNVYLITPARSVKTIASVRVEVALDA